MTDTSTAAVERLDNILETHFDTQRSVEQDPCGATEAIENALLMIRAISAERDAAVARVERVQSALKKAANRLDWCIGLIQNDVARDKASSWPDEARAALSPDAKGE